LRDLLKAQKWKEADYQTHCLMLMIVGKLDHSLLFRENLFNFPCKDLKTIDRLWLQASQGRYGFSVQKEIYVRCGGKLDGLYPGDEISYKFQAEVGWRPNNSWSTNYNYNDLIWDSPGALPARWCALLCGSAFPLFYRIETCEV
jgi:hypothetical protein